MVNYRQLRLSVINGPNLSAGEEVSITFMRYFIVSEAEKLFHLMLDVVQTCMSTGECLLHIHLCGTVWQRLSLNLDEK